MYNHQYTASDLVPSERTGFCRFWTLLEDGGNEVAIATCMTSRHSEVEHVSDGSFSDANVRLLHRIVRWNGYETTLHGRAI